MHSVPQKITATVIDILMYFSYGICTRQRRVGAPVYPSLVKGWIIISVTFYSGAGQN
jgi:hypothetical protein